MLHYLSIVSSSIMIRLIYLVKKTNQSGSHNAYTQRLDVIVFE